MRLLELEHVWNALYLHTDVLNRVTTFCYKKVRAEAAMTYCTLTG